MTTDTATEAAAIAQRATKKAVDRIYHLLDETDISANHIRYMEGIIAAELAPFVARAEAGDRLAKLLAKLDGDVRWMLNERKFLSPSTIDFDAIESALAAYRALAEQEAG